MWNILYTVYYNPMYANYGRPPPYSNNNNNTNNKNTPPLQPPSLYVMRGEPLAKKAAARVHHRPSDSSFDDDVRPRVYIFPILSLHFIRPAYNIKLYTCACIKYSLRRVYECVVIAHVYIYTYISLYNNIIHCQGHAGHNTGRSKRTSRIRGRGRAIWIIAFLFFLRLLSAITYIPTAAAAVDRQRISA